MRLRLLGGFNVEGVSERDLGSRKARTLLKLLALRRGAPVSVDTIAEVLWDREQPSRPAEQVGVLVSRLRSTIGSDRIARTDAGYALDADWVDVDEVDTLTSTASAALAEGRIGAARAAAHAALDLVRGPLLGAEEGTWIEPARVAADAIVSRARRVAVDAALAVGDVDAAVALAEGLLAADPYDEAVLRSLMRAHLVVRRPASALAAYSRQRERLAADLGVPPTRETEALYAEALQAADGDSVIIPQPTSSPAERLIVGRELHLAALDDSLAAVTAGETQLVVVRGDAGMGKTALVDAWSAAVSGVLLLRGRCDELGRDLPLQPIADSVADHLRVLGADATRVLADDAEALASLIGPIAGSAGAGATSVTDADQGRSRVFVALVATITRAACERPVVLVLEDLHHAAGSTVAWLAFALRRVSRMLVIATTRSQPPSGLTPSRSISVTPLTIDDIATLAGEARAAELYERSGGHPLLVAAFINDRDHGSGLSSVGDAVRAQLDATGRQAATTVRVAAVTGLDCDADLIAAVRGISTVDVVLHLEAAAATGLVVERGSGFSFRHELVRDAVLSLSSAAHVAALHRQTAHALARRPRVDHLAVAVHAREGGDQELAAKGFIAAADAAAARFDLDAAEAHLAEAIAAAPDGPDAYVARARVRISRSAFADAERDARIAVAAGAGAPALEVAGWVAYYRRRYDEARAYADEAIIAAGKESPLRVSAAALAGRVRHGAGDLYGALEHLCAPGEAPLALRGVADVWLAQVRLHQGRPIDALAALTRPLLVPDSLAHPWAPLHLRFNHAMALGQLGRVADAIAVADELEDVAAGEGAVGRRFRAPAANVAAWVLRWSGRLEEADERNRAALDATGGDTGPAADALAEGHYVALLDLADGRVLAGDVAGTEALLTRLRVVDTWDGTMAWHQRHRLGLLRSRVALADGDRTGAAGLALDVARDAAARGASRYELLALATAGIADASIPTSRLAPVVDGLGRCAALDGWPLVARLGRERGVDRWFTAAQDRAAAMVAEVGDGDRIVRAARRFAERALMG